MYVLKGRLPQTLVQAVNLFGLTYIYVRECVLSNINFANVQGGGQCEDSGRKEACDGFQDQCSVLQG